jgi:hypothetical protein
MLDQSYTQTSIAMLTDDMLNKSDTEQDMVQPVSERTTSSAQLQAEIMAPGHLYNARTGTGIEWFAPDATSGEPGKVRLWSRGWAGESVLISEAEHKTFCVWDYWYSLEFARSFPFVTHWWFGDAWTGLVRIWGPDAVGCDPESGAPMLSGWMRFHNVAELQVDEEDEEDEHEHEHEHEENVDHAEYSPFALPWTLLVTNPARVSMPMPPGFTNAANLPLQLLLADRLMDLLHASAKIGDRDNCYIGDQGNRGHRGNPDNSVRVKSAESAESAAGEVGERGSLIYAITSLVRKDDLERAFPSSFGPWRLDRLAGMTPREALCRLQGIDAQPME